MKIRNLEREQMDALLHALQHNYWPPLWPVGKDDEPVWCEPTRRQP